MGRNLAHDKQEKEGKNFISNGMFSGRRNASAKALEARMTKVVPEQQDDHCGCGFLAWGSHAAERKPWNKPHIIKYNYKKFKHMLRNTQLYISMYFQNHNLRHFGMVVVHFLCRGSLSFQKGYQKFFTFRKNLVKEGQEHYNVDLKANICSSPR